MTAVKCCQCQKFIEIPRLLLHILVIFVINFQFKVNCKRSSKIDSNPISSPLPYFHNIISLDKILKRLWIDKGFREEYFLKYYPTVN